MAWTITVGSLVLVDSDNGSFSIESSMTHNANGTPQTRETIVEIQTDIVRATIGPISDRVRELYNLLSNQNPVTVTLNNGIEDKWKFTPANSIGSPVITQFRAQRAPGAGKKHWNVLLAVRITQTAAQSEDDEATTDDDDKILQFKFETRNLKNHLGQTIKKVFQAAAEAKSVGIAQKFIVSSFKPISIKVKQEIDRDNQGNKAFATWVWDFQRTANIIDVIEDQPTLFGGGTILVPDYLVSQPGEAPDNAPDAILHVGRSREARLVVRGTVLGYDLGEMQAIIDKPHFAEGVGITRAPHLEARSFPFRDPKIDEARFIQNFNEVYLVTNKASMQPPDHSDHFDFVVFKNPQLNL